MMFASLVALLFFVACCAASPSPARGYVCATGTPPWRDTDMISELDAFLEAYKEQRAVFGSARKDPKGGVNFGGNGMYHSLALWFLVRRLQPTAVIESGVFKGATSWLIQRAHTWAAPLTLVQLDPSPAPATPALTNSSEQRVIQLRGSSFVDFAQVDWRRLGLVPESSLILFDDHQDQMGRLEEAQARGFAHLVFDDNYLPGSGDAFSIKVTCHGARRGALLAHVPSFSPPPSDVWSPRPTYDSTRIVIRRSTHPSLLMCASHPLPPGRVRWRPRLRRCRRRRHRRRWQAA